MTKKMTEEKLRVAVKNSISIAEVLKNLEMSVTTANYRSFHKAVKTYDLDTEHFLGRAHLKGESHAHLFKSLETILVKDSDYLCTSHLKKRLLDKNFLTYKCYECGLATWCNKPISLQLDHINGIHNDHRIENLRLLCPNCHSQTSNFAGRNKMARSL